MDIWCQLNSSHLWIALYTDETSDQFNNFFLYSFKTARHTNTSNEKFVFMSATTWTWNSPPVIKKKGFKSINRSGEVVAHLIHIISSFTLVTCVHNLMIVTRNYYMPRGLGSRLLSRDLKDKIQSFLSSRLSEKSFVLFIQYPPDFVARSAASRPKSTLKFMRSTCGKSTAFLRLHETWHEC